MKKIALLVILCLLFSSCSKSPAADNSSDTDTSAGTDTLTQPIVSPELSAENEPESIAETAQEVPQESVPNETQESPTGTPAWIYGENVNFREAGSLDAGVITRLSAPQKLTLFSINGEWAFVEANGTQGYVHTDYITLEDPAEAAGAANLSTTPEDEPQIENLAASTGGGVSLGEVALSSGGGLLSDNASPDGGSSLGDTAPAGGAASPADTAPINLERGVLTVAIDAGHQAKGNNEHEPIGPGASSTKPKVSYGTSGISSGVPEYKLTLEVSLKLRDELTARGYNVFMVRETHEVNISNRERANMATQAAADVFVRIHADGSENTSVNGILTLSPSADNPFVSNLYNSSYALSESILSAMVEATGAKNRGVSKVDNMSGINWATMPVSIIEMGLMTNYSEDELMQTDEYQMKLVNGIANGIDRYFAE
jgi:N-acetylmuramoyl-L-alanine amidase